MLKKKFIQSGEWLFKWRSYLPSVLVLIIIPGFLNFNYPLNSYKAHLLWDIVCLLISFFGLFIRCYAIGYVPKRTSGRNTKGQIAETVNTTGIYSLVRHPLYLGNFFMGFGVISFFGLWWIDLIYALSFWLYYERIMAAEEAFLEQKFGRVYQEYAEKTPTFLPDFKHWIPHELPFSFRNVLKREYNGFFAVIFLMTFFEMIGNYLVLKEIKLGTLWITIFLVGLVIYLILRTLKRNTRWLKVEGR